MTMILVHAHIKLFIEIFMNVILARSTQLISNFDFLFILIYCYIEITLCVPFHKFDSCEQTAVAIAWRIHGFSETKSFNSLIEKKIEEQTSLQKKDELTT